VKPHLFTIFSHWVPFPLPGPPQTKIIVLPLNSAIFKYKIQLYSILNLKQIKNKKEENK
jgi:hypothetical protein